MTKQKELKKYNTNKIRVWYYKENVSLLRHLYVNSMAPPSCANLNNYGDYLGDYIPRKLTNKEIVYTPIDDPEKKYVTCGSVLNQYIGINHNCIVWGAGIITKHDAIPKGVELLAVRGPYTQQRLRTIGIPPPDTVGDPALLLKRIHDPKIEKKYKLGIIPNYIDNHCIQNKFNNNPHVKVINLITDDVEKTTDEIISCENTISSSLHGVIVSHVYGIPSVWVKFSDKLSGNAIDLGDDIKFRDYFSSVGIEPYDGVNYIDKEINIEEALGLVEEFKGRNAIVDFDFDKLYKSCPFT